MITVDLPLRVTSEANRHEHWRYRSGRAANQKRAARLAVGAAAHKAGFFLAIPLVVTLTRFGKQLLDSDNLVGAFKHVRDGIASVVDVDDRSSQYTWIYKQEKAGYNGIRIQIERRRP